MGDWLRAEVTGPLGIDFHIGVPADALGRVAETVTADMLDGHASGGRAFRLIYAVHQGRAAL